MDRDAAVGARRARGDGFGIAHGAAFGAVGGGKDMRETLVDPVDDARVRAVVAEQAQVFQANVADAVRPHAQEEADIGLAETVDRLHRVADHEQGAPVGRRPAACQLFQQFDLEWAGVLEFVDQQM